MGIGGVDSGDRFGQARCWESCVRTWWVMLCAVGACQPQEECDGSARATFLCAGDYLVDVGTGETAFEGMAAGTTWPLVRGPQGLQHLVVALRTGAPADVGTRAFVLLGLVDPDTGDALQPELSLGVGLGPGGDALGVRLVVPEPLGILGRPVALTASLQVVGEDAVGRAWHPIEVAWADDIAETTAVAY